MDQSLLLAFRTADDPAMPLGPMWLQEAVRDIAALGGYTILSIATPATATFLRLTGQKRGAIFIVTAAVYLTLGALLARPQHRRRLRLFFVGLAVMITVLVGLSRVDLGVHWPSDVVAGWTLGGGWAVACWLVATWFWADRFRPNEADQPGAVLVSRSPASTTSAEATAGGSSRSA